MIDTIIISKDDKVLCITYWNVLELNKVIHHDGNSYIRIIVHLDDVIDLPRNTTYCCEMLSMKFRGYLSGDGKTIIED